MVGLMGPAGAGQLTKMVNQICIAGLVQGLAEGIHFAKQAGLDVEKVDRRHLQGRGAVLADGKPLQDDERRASSTSASPSTGCARTSASASTRRARNGAHLPVTALVDQFYADVQAMGGGRWDTSSLLKRLEQIAGPSAALTLLLRPLHRNLRRGACRGERTLG